jgi:hypothetical protein
MQFGSNDEENEENKGQVDDSLARCWVRYKFNFMCGVEGMHGNPLSTKDCCSSSGRLLYLPREPLYAVA